MKIKLVFLFFLFVGCKATKVKTHPLLRTDGFYYRQKAGDIYQLVRFYRNGRVAVSRRLAKKELIPEYPNVFMCNVDTARTRDDLKICSYTVKNDSVFFLKKPDNYPCEPYNVRFAGKLYPDSLVSSLQVVDFDSTVAEKFPFVTLKINPKIMTSFKFLKASSKRREFDPDSPGKKYDIPKSGKNGKLIVEEL